MIHVRVAVTGGGSDDDLINNAREAVSRAGYQVGDFQETGADPVSEGRTLYGNLEVDDRLFNELCQGAGWTKLHYGDCAVLLEVR